MILGIAILVTFLFTLIVIGNKSRIRYIQFFHLPIETVELSPEELELVSLMNEHRINIGLPVLIPEALACEVCRIRVEKDIAENVYTNHEGWAEMVAAAKVNDDSGSHIHGSNFLSAKDLFEGYMKSPNHKAIIEKKDRTHIGLSYKQRRNHCLIVKYN